MGRDADVIVVGGGITGVATLRALARAGADALLLERFELGHSRGSSHGSSRIFRLSYPDAHYTRLAVEALERWRELETERGESLIVHTGSLDVGDAATGTQDALDELDIPFELISADTAAARWRLDFQPGAQLVFQPDGGYSLAARSHTALTASATEAGGKIEERTQVTAIEPSADGVAVATTTGTLVARALVVAAGAWTREQLAPLGIDLPVTAARETIAYFAHPGGDALPSLIEYPSETNTLPEGQAYYALAAPGHGLKAGIHHAGYHDDPDAEGVPDERVVEETSAWISRRFPDADPHPLGTETCLYTNTADQGFVIEAHGRVVVASACSGHGFKFAPVHGARAARLALDASS